MGIIGIGAALMLLRREKALFGTRHLKKSVGP